MKGFPKQSKRSKQRARQKAEREAYRNRPLPVSPPRPAPPPPDPQAIIAEALEASENASPPLHVGYGGDPVLGAVLGALHAIRQRKKEQADG